METDFGGGLWQLVLQSGWTARCVILVLLGFSVLSWGIIFNKWSTFRKVKRQSDEFYALFRNSQRLADVYKAADDYPLAPIASVFKSGYDELSLQLRAGQSIERSPTQSISDRPRIATMHSIERTLQKSAQSQMTGLETSLSWLATTGAVAPFVGLFGTVIGIINAFEGLGAGGASTIQSVAPGISEALVTTAAGLFAAIPAVMGYNQFVHRLKVFGTEINGFQGRTTTSLSEINVTPLVDVVLVLLIIFMVTAPILQTGIDINLPETRTVTEVDPANRAVVSISQDEKLYFRSDVVNYDQLPSLLSREVPDKGAPVYVRADQEVKWKTVVAVLDQLRLVGYRNIQVVTRPWKPER
jgi:biopolymer transport protein TolQ